MTKYRYKDRYLTTWEKFFPPKDYDCGCGSDPYCVCGYFMEIVIGLPWIVICVAVIVALYRSS